MQPLIEFKNTVFSVNPERNIINHFSATINRGDFVVLLGGNGSGKSTLLKLMNRTYPITSGDIFFKGQSLNTINFKSIRDNIITITQFISDSIFSELTVEENAILIESSGAIATQTPFVKKELLAQLPGYLHSFNPNLSKALKTRIKNLSGGEQQILAFALYVRIQPDLLLLDEHTSALDPKKSDTIMTLTNEFIQKKGLTCLMTTHTLDDALKYGNRIMAIRDGALIFDADQVKKSSLKLADLLAYCY